MTTSSALEDLLAKQLWDAGFVNFVREHKFGRHLGPKGRVAWYRFDFAWPDELLAVEVEGATHARGRHTRGSGYEKDCQKYNTAALEGWTVLRFTGAMVKDGRALQTIEDAWTVLFHRPAR